MMMYNLNLKIDLESISKRDYDQFFEEIKKKFGSVNLRFYSPLPVN